MKVDYYRIDRFDASELLEAYQNSDDALGAAIDTCRERARLYCIPCDWAAEWCNDGSILVKLTRNSQAGQGLIVYLIFLLLVAIAFCIVAEVVLDFTGQPGLLPMIDSALRGYGL